MRYAVKLSDKLYASGIRTFRTHGRRKVLHTDSSTKLHEALTYADGGAARLILGLIREKHKDAMLVHVSEQDIFKAKLADR